MEACDLLCFVFDSSDVNSFSYIVELRVSIDKYLIFDYYYTYINVLLLKCLEATQFR